MEKVYKTIEIHFGNLEDAVLKLITHSVKNNGELVCCEFNGKTLYSDTVSLDSAYLMLTDKTYDQFNEDQNAWHEEYKRQEEEHKQTIPNLTTEWQKKGHEILAKDKWDYWDRIVPIRLGDLYHGMELGASLDIIQILNKNGTIKDAKAMIDSQDHSGMSYSLVRNMVREFCDRGEEFSEATKY